MLFGDLSRKGKVLAFLILIQVMFTVICKFFPQVEELFYLSLGFGLAVITYASTIRCPKCGKSQVFTGISFFDLRLPKMKCHYCGKPVD